MPLPAISVTIIAKNSEQLIGECLHALRDFDEVVLLDNASSDDTVRIASGFGNVKIYRSGLTGFGALKNAAVSHAANGWILSVDSDEIVTPELLEEIGNLRLDPQTVYSIPRENYFDGRLIKCCGWHPDRVLRLFHRKHTRFNDNLVHESLVLSPDTRVRKLRNRIRHYPYRSAAELIEKMQLYSTLYARDNKGRKRSSPVRAVSRALFTFFKNYFLQRGFLYGYEGLLISWTNAGGVFYKYMKLYEYNRELKRAESRDV